MTHDFTPPGGLPDSEDPSKRDDARAGLAATTSGAGAESGRASAHAAPGTMLRSGRRLAMAAWVAIVAGVALLIGIVWSAVLAFTDQTLNFAELGETGPMSTAQVVAGMCLTEVGADGNVEDTEVVACNEPHRAEVFTQMTFDLAKHPGADHVTSEALDYCEDRVAGLLPHGASWVAWTPSEQSWSRGDRVALCIGVFDEPKSEPVSPHGIRGIGGDDTNRDGLDA